MNDDYLWDPSARPDPETLRLEQLLGRFRAPEKNFDPASLPGDFPPSPRRFGFLSAARLAAAAVVAVAVLTGVWYALRFTKPAWEVERVAGAPKVGSRTIGETARLRVGDWLETDSSSRAKISVNEVGEVEIEPNTRIRLLQARPTEHRLGLARGTMKARIWAPPRLFYVNTPSANAIDLGCQYTLHVDESGAGRLRVTLGWVAFEQNGRESFVPAGAVCVTRPGVGPGTPYFDDASEAFRAALEQYDFGPRAASVRAACLDLVLAQARKRDALTLWHLLSRTTGTEQTRVYDRLAQFVPPPSGVTREGILGGDRQMRDRWWDALGLGDAWWWRMWKGPVPTR